jgi:hypothetical protein
VSLLGGPGPVVTTDTTGDRWSRSALGGDPEQDPSILGFTVPSPVGAPYTEPPTVPVKEESAYKNWLFGLGIPGYQYGGPDPFEFPQLYPDWSPDPEVIDEYNLIPAPEGPKRILWPILAAIGLVIAAREGIL